MLPAVRAGRSSPHANLLSAQHSRKRDYVLTRNEEVCAQEDCWKLPLHVASCNRKKPVPHRSVASAGNANHHALGRGRQQTRSIESGRARRRTRSIDSVVAVDNVRTSGACPMYSCGQPALLSIATVLVTAGLLMGIKESTGGLVVFSLKSADPLHQPPHLPSLFDPPWHPLPRLPTAPGAPPTSSLSPLPSLPPLPEHPPPMPRDPPLSPPTPPPLPAKPPLMPPPSQRPGVLVMERINERYARGQPTSKLVDAGVLIHMIDGTFDEERPWLKCNDKMTWCRGSHWG